MPKLTRHQSHFAHGYEPGSVYAQMNPREQKAFRQWMKDRAADGRAYERGLRGTTHRGRSAGADFAEV